MRAGRTGDAVLVTGAARGIGLAIALRLARGGFRVWAGLRDRADAAAVLDAAREAGVSLDVVALDVTDAGSVDAAVEAVVQACGGLYAVVNNAGMTVAGFFEDLTDAEVRSVFEVNLFGAMAVTRRALPVLRRAGGGRLVMISSYCGRIGTVAAAPYVTTKFALEGWAESLSLEVRALGVDVTLIEPGVVPTRLLGAGRRVAAGARSAASPYAAWFASAEREADALVAGAGLTPDHVARAVARALGAARPRLRYTVGRRASALLWLRKRMPERLFERLYFGEMLRRVTGESVARAGRAS